MAGPTNPNTPPNPNGSDPAELWQKIADEMPEFKVGLVDQNEELRDKAIFAGENKLAEILNSKEKGIKPIVRKIWQGNLMRNYYRQKYINEAREEIIQSGSLVHEEDDKTRRYYNSEVCKIFLSDVDGIIDAQAGDTRESLLAKNPQLHARIQEIVSKYADGTIQDIEEVRRLFAEAIDGFRDENFDGSDLSVSNIEEVAIAAKERFDSLNNVAQNMNAKFEHDDAMGRIMKGFDVMYGRRNVERSEAKFNKVDALVDKISKTKAGSLVSATTIALSVGAAASITELVTKKTLGAAIGYIPGVSAMVFGAARESRDFSRDLARANFDSRFNREFESEKNRDKMMGLTYKRRGAGETAKNLDRLMRQIEIARGAGINYAFMRDELLQAITDCKVLLELEKTDTPVLSYSSEVDAPREQLDLLKTFAEAKKFLKDDGIDDIDERMNPDENTTEARARLINKSREMFATEREEQERLARKAKVARVAKKAAVGLVSGVVIGTAMREISALFNPNVQGIFEKDGPNGHDYSQKLTACKKLAMMIKGEKFDGGGGDFHMDLGGTGDVIDNANNFDFAKAPDGTYTLMHDGKELATGLDWNSHDGHLTMASIVKLEKQGIHINQTGFLKGPDQLVGYKPGPMIKQEVGLGDAIERKLANFKDVSRSYWYDNDSSAYDLNELGLMGYTDPTTGAKGLVTSFTDAGSFHNGVNAGFSNLVSGDKIKLMISATADTQSTAIEVAGKVLDNGQVAFCPESGTDLSQFFNSDGKFLGKFAEVVHVLGEEDGVTKIAPLATVTGDGLPDCHFTDFIKGDDIPIYEPLSIPEYSFEMPEQGVVFPMFLPFIRPTKPINDSRIKPRPRTPVGPSVYTGYGYYGRNGYNGDPFDSLVSHWNEYGEWVPSTPFEVEKGQQLGEISPRIEEGKQLQTGREVDWYVNDQMKTKQGQEHFDKVNRQVDNCDFLKGLDDKVKTIVTIPVFGITEMDNIYGTLSQFAAQKGIDADSYGVLLDLNWRPESKLTPDEVKDLVDKTRESIEKAKRDFPNLKIGVVEQFNDRGVIADVARFMNDTIMVGIDRAIKSGQMSADHDITIVRTDADLMGVNDAFVAGYQNAAAKNPKTPLFTGQSWFDIGRQTKAPGFGAVMFLERAHHLLEGSIGRRADDWGDGVGKEVFTEGRNFGYSAKHFAAINCFGFAADDADGGDWLKAGSDDLRVGFRMESALKNLYRQKAYNGEKNDEMFENTTRFIVRSDSSQLVTDDNRQLQAYMLGLEHPDTDWSSANTYADRNGGYDASVARPSDAQLEAYTEEFSDPQRFNAIVDQFEREMESLVTRDTWNKSHMFETTLAWFFGVEKSDLPTIYTTEHKERGPNVVVSGNRDMRFHFTDHGKQVLRDTLVKRMGDGAGNPALVSTLQQVVQNNAWGNGGYVQPVPTPAA